MKGVEILLYAFHCLYLHTMWEVLFWEDEGSKPESIIRVL